MLEGKAEYDYLTGQRRESFAAIFERYAQECAKALNWPDLKLHQRYGEHQRCVYDFFPPRVDLKHLGTVVYLHAGYWQSRDKSQFHWLGPTLANLGWGVVFANYPLCPEVSVKEIVEAIKPLLPALKKANVTQTGLPTILVGHSAGAHLAVELGLAAAPFDEHHIDAVLAISGVYDLSPLIHTTLNVNLKLDDETARQVSPLHRIDIIEAVKVANSVKSDQGVHGENPPQLTYALAPALFVVGQAETQAFIDQNQKMCDAWQKGGGLAHVQIVPHADHFTILNHFSYLLDRMAI